MDKLAAKVTGTWRRCFAGYDARSIGKVIHGRYVRRCALAMMLLRHYHFVQRHRTSRKGPQVQSIAFTADSYLLGVGREGAYGWPARQTTVCNELLLVQERRWVGVTGSPCEMPAAKDLRRSFR